MQNRSRKRKSEELTPEMFARKKLSSLRMLNSRMTGIQDPRGSDRQTFKRLQRSLEKDNKEQQPLAQPIPVLPDDQIQKDEVGLWNEFLDKAEKVKSKVQKERVNCYQRQFLNLSKQFKGQLQARKNCIQGLQGAVKDKYRQIHLHFSEIKQQQAMNIFNTTGKIKKGKKNNNQLVIDNNKKVITLKETINQLREQIVKIDSEIRLLETQQKRSCKEWLYFIKKLLKEGYYLKKGVAPILQELNEVNYNLKFQDLPRCLDEVSKRCLLLQYKKIKSFHEQEIPKRRYSEADDRLKGIANSNLIRDVYKGAKQYMATLVRNRSEKIKQEFVLPPINTKRQNLKKSFDWRDNERKRLSHVYTGQEYNLARSILFGPKVETIIKS